MSLFARALVEATRLRRRTRGPLREAWPLELEAWSRFLHHYSRRSLWLPLSMQRRALGSLSPKTPPSGVTLEPVSIDGVPAEWIVPSNAAGDGALLYLHGGGYALGSIASHRHFIAKVAREAKMRALAIDYRLAPEHPFPAAVDDALRAWRWLLRQGADPALSAIAGESAGGGLTMATLLSQRDDGEPLPGAAVVLSPWVDLTLSGATIDSNNRFDFVPRHVLTRYARGYAGREALDHPLVSPLHADLSGLPPLLIQAGEAETLLDDSRRLHRRAVDAGVDARLSVYPDMIHAFMLMRGMPDAPRAIAEIAAHIRPPAPS